MAHADARLTPAGRLTLVRRITAQPRRPIAHIASTSRRALHQRAHSAIRATAPTTSSRTGTLWNWDRGPRTSLAEPLDEPATYRSVGWMPNSFASYDLNAACVTSQPGPGRRGECLVTLLVRIIDRVGLALETATKATESRSRSVPRHA
jgi:hypothetical protein